MAFRLPPLSSLRVFEAAARHGSFRKAADELNLTASAVSHGVQNLESWLGVELFNRGPRALRLSAAGRIYAPLINEALNAIARATDQLPGRKATGTLSISAAPTFANRILLPRLDRFAARHPQTRVTLDTSQRVVDLNLDDFDIAIRFASLKKPASNRTLLVVETLVPVCSVGLRTQFGGASDATLLSRAPLIHVTSVSDDWDYWFRSNGVAPPPARDGGLRVDTIQMGFDAARRGLGIVLGRRPLVDEDIASGALLPLAVQTVRSHSGYWLVTPQTEYQKPEVKLFRRWLLAELGVAAEPRKAARPSLRTKAASRPLQPKQAASPARKVSKNTTVP